MKLKIIVIIMALAAFSASANAMKLKVAIGEKVGSAERICSLNMVYAWIDGNLVLAHDSGTVFQLNAADSSKVLRVDVEAWGDHSDCDTLFVEDGRGRYLSVKSTDQSAEEFEATLSKLAAVKTCRQSTQ